MPGFFLHNKAAPVKARGAKLPPLGDDAPFGRGARAMFGMGDAIFAAGVVGYDVEPFHARIVLRATIKFKVWKKN